MNHPDLESRLTFQEKRVLDTLCGHPKFEEATRYFTRDGGIAPTVFASLHGHPTLMRVSARDAR
jgi:hypothetical protein